MRDAPRSAETTARLVVCRVNERVLDDELPGLVVHPLDVGLELATFDPPLTSATDLDGDQVATADEGVGL